MKTLIALIFAAGLYAQAPLPPSSGSGGGGGGGTGCVPVGLVSQILTDDGAGGCTSNTPTISGSTITASLTGHASLDLPLTGGTLTGNLLFSTDNTKDIGASGATRPRDFFLGRNALVGGTLGVTGNLTINVATGTQCLHANSSGVVSGTGSDCGSGGGGITIGTTTITSGTTTRILYDNGGVVGEYAVGTGVPTFLATPSGANLASALTTPLTSTGGGLGAALNAAAAHSTVISNGASPAVYAAKVIPDCPTGALGFTQSTDAFGCNSAGSGTVNSGNANDFAFYAGTGTAVSDLGAGMVWTTGTSTTAHRLTLFCGSADGVFANTLVVSDNSSNPVFATLCGTFGSSGGILIPAGSLTTGAYLTSDITNTLYIGGRSSGSAASVDAQHYVCDNSDAPPVIASGFGSSPAIAGSDCAIRITVGTGGTAQTGVITFGLAWPAIPSCSANDEGAVLLVQAVSTTGNVTLNSSVPWGVGHVITVTCMGSGHFQ